MSKQLRLTALKLIMCAFSSACFIYVIVAALAAEHFALWEQVATFLWLMFVSVAAMIWMSSSSRR